MYRGVFLCRVGFVHSHVATFFICPAQPFECVVNSYITARHTVGEGVLKLGECRVGMSLDILVQSGEIVPGK